MKLTSPVAEKETASNPLLIVFVRKEYCDFELETVETEQILITKFDQLTSQIIKQVLSRIIVSKISRIKKVTTVFGLC